MLAAFVILAAMAGCSSAEIIAVESKDEEVRDVTGYIIQRDLGNSVGFKSSDGLTVLYLGTYRAKPADPSPESPDAEVKQDEGIFSVFMVKSDKDTGLKLDVLDGVDAQTNKFSYRSGDWGYIAGTLVNGNPRDISGGFWVRVTFWHVIPFRFGERPLIARIGFVINGHEVSVKRFRPRTWGDWSFVEREYAVPLEEDNRRVEFEEFSVKPE